ncbi:hypothetical protein PE067_08180 [Paracoccus sp. DMF-8]|uniref:hypothetical protein n=1 Tax=Paracoccus sp. DMF-8 TaxID=3019445 RepID=UPI0023E7F529|nr:hypothetical protein [Paracoccus sp. DMF-8]MDF3606105.1 hypothetical protein [Paracoccus sp. DMF-8]
MTDKDRIIALEEQLAQLTENARQADATLALFLGMLIELSPSTFSFDPTATLGTIGAPGWPDTLIERISEGQEMIRRSRNHHH